MAMHTIRRMLARMTLALGMAALLSGCLLAPGSFVSTLDLRKDGQFSFTYSGEISMVGLSRLSQMADNEEGGGEQAGGDDGEAFKALLGGIDPADPAAGEEIAGNLARQKGWNRVEYRGDGLFSVDFAIASSMSHDFVFPLIEDLPMANNFVQAHLREGNVVRIEAPGFSAEGAGASPASGFLQAATMGGGEEEGETPSPLPELDGRFTITTDAAILANNTDEGPQNVANGQQLSWVVNRRLQAAPMALIRLGE